MYVQVPQVVPNLIFSYSGRDSAPPVPVLQSIHSRVQLQLSLGLLTPPIHNRAVSLYSSQDTCPCFHCLCISFLPFSLTSRAVSKGVLLTKLLEELEFCFPKIQGADFTLRLTHIPQDCEFHQCMITAAQAASNLDRAAGIHGALSGGEEELRESLWFGIKEMTGKGDIIVGVCYSPPDHEEQMDEALYRQIGAASCLQILVLMGDFNQPDIYWRDNTAGHKQSRRFLECIADSFFLQVIERPRRRHVLLDLILTNKEGLVGEVKVKGSLGCSVHEMVESRILKARRKVKSKLTTLDVRRADLGLFKDLL
ncbi:hypothetical protein QYF61_006853 [Mycteria americana]|uniref:Endonuclease/exonuclease/phosphatase domain-containing protein n=1 Tax=Mycteria americana TaxID=33587 RepID=A0AAN7NLX9_MYCAM|nr:hypothetical protein QYF61_006853 [Mycteria americana]